MMFLVFDLAQISACHVSSSSFTFGPVASSSTVKDVLGLSAIKSWETFLVRCSVRRKRKDYASFPLL